MRRKKYLRQPLSEALPKSWDMDTTLDYIANECPVDRAVVEELVKKYRIAKLLTLDTDTSELSVQLKEFELKLKNMSEFVLEQYGWRKQ